MNSGTLTRVLEFLNKYEERPMWEIEKVIFLHLSLQIIVETDSLNCIPLIAFED